MGMQQIKTRHSVGVVDNAFAVDQRRPRLEFVRCLDDARKACGPVGTVPGEDPDLVLHLAHHQPVAVEFKLDEPIRPHWRLLRNRWDAGFDETG
jgi:hypothetical protein